MKKEEFLKMKRLRNLRDNFQCSNIWIIGIPEGEEEEQEIENLFENIMKAKEMNFQEYQRSWIQGSTHQGTS